MTIDEIQAVVDKMNPPRSDDHRWFGTPHFTGWKSSIPRQGVTPEENERLAAGIRTPEEIDLVGQWLYAVSKDGPFFYVNLPGMQAGRYQKGDEFYIGDERVYSNTPPEEIERLLKLGLKKLLLLVDVHG